MTIVTRFLHAQDQAAFSTFLDPHTEWAYFLRSNARKGGLEFHGEPYQAEYIGAWDGAAMIGVISHSWMGSVQCFVTDAAAITPLATAFAVLRQNTPRPINCLLGKAEYIHALRQDFGFSDADFRDATGLEDLFTLELSRMQSFPALVGGDLSIRRADTQDTEKLTQWRHDFFVEALGDTPGENTYTKSSDEIIRRIAERDLFVLVKENQPVSFCGAGGWLPDWKIVGPVYTPPDQRGKGYARFVTAGALTQLAQEGATHAVLFTSNPAAARAYEAIGFARRGQWRLDFFHKPLVVLPVPPSLPYGRGIEPNFEPC